MNDKPADILLIGFGNPGRLDDGLGPAFADAVEAMNIDGVTVDADYQLAVEDSAAVAAHQTVVFADAAVDGPAPFSFRRLEARAKVPLGFTSHSVRPEAVLVMAREMFDSEAEAYMLGIRGYEFNQFAEGLSTPARRNLRAALEFIEPVLRGRTFRQAAPRPEIPATRGAEPCKEST